jgi:ribosomal protein L25 (general stress protein Ctc)
MNKLLKYSLQRSPRCVYRLTKFSTLEYPNIEVETRLIDGSRRSRQLRAQKKVPGVIYGTDEFGNKYDINVLIEKILIDKEVREKKKSLECTIYNLVLDKTSQYKVVPRQIQFNPCKFSVFINF